MAELSSELESLKIDRSRSSRSGTALRWLGALSVLGLLAWLAQTQGKAYLEAKVFKLEVQVGEIHTVSSAQASVELTSTGYVVPQLVSRVGAKLRGRVIKVHVKEGQRVKAGDVLIELDRADREAGVVAARSRVAAAQARVATARATHAETRLQADRERELVVMGAAPKAKADDLEARAVSLQQSIKAAQAEVKASEAEVAALKVNLRYLRITAPIDGTIISDPPELGEMVGGGEAASIELADFESILVETDIPEGRLHMVKVGSPCEIVLDAFPRRRFRGQAHEVSPRVDRAKATVGVKVKFLDPIDGVLPDMAARVSFLQEALDEEAMRQPPKTVVPVSAVVERAGAKVVFVLEDDRVRVRTVSVGPPFGGGLELLEGPASGTRVVTDPPDTLVDGQEVREAT